MCIVDDASYRGTNHTSSAVVFLRRLECVGMGVDISLLVQCTIRRNCVRVKSEQKNTVVMHTLIIVATDGEGARRLLRKLLQGSDLQRLRLK
jgi:hypothetical protein